MRQEGRVPDRGGVAFGVGDGHPRRNGHTPVRSRKKTESKIITSDTNSTSLSQSRSPVSPPPTPSLPFLARPSSRGESQLRCRPSFQTLHPFRIFNTFLLFALFILSLLSSPAFADVQFTSPAPGATLPGGGALQVAWQDSGRAPLLKDLQTYQLTLCAGGSKEGSYIELLTLVPSGSFSLGNVAQGVVPATIGGPAPNGYFLKMLSTAPGRGTVTNFSKRFSLSGMVGNFPPDIVAALKTVGPSVVTGPPDINKISAKPANNKPDPNPPGGANNPAADDGLDLQIGTALFGVPFAKQKGPTRYAPMQSVPPTKVPGKKVKPTPLHPTSKVEIATTRLPPAKGIYTTVTQSRTYSMATMENQIVAAPGPHAHDEEWEKYLNRWKD